MNTGRPQGGLSLQGYTAMLPGDPIAVHSFRDGAYRGYFDLLERDPLAVYAARKVPADAILDCEQLVENLAGSGIVLAGGWHSPLEKRLFRRAVRVPAARLIHALAKGMAFYRPDHTAGQLLEQRRLLIVAPRLSNRRISQASVEQRDRWMRSVCRRYLFCFPDPEGYTYRLLQTALKHNKEVFIFDHPRTAGLFEQEAIGVNNRNWKAIFRPG